MMTSKMLNVCCGTGLQATTKINVHSTAENNTVHMNIIKNVSHLPENTTLGNTLTNAELCADVQLR
jgi:diphthamide biosynthesis methyltransferase